MSLEEEDKKALEQSKLLAAEEEAKKRYESLLIAETAQRRAENSFQTTSSPFDVKLLRLNRGARNRMFVDPHLLRK